MDVQLNKEENGVQLTLSFSIQGTKEKVWEFIHTKEGLATWFPELRYEENEIEDQLLFVANGITEKLQILKDEPFKTFSFQWAEAEITFLIIEKDENSITLIFKEQAPFSFPDLTNDLTSWTLQMVHLTNQVENIPYEFNQERFEEIKKEYRQQLEQHPVDI